MKSKYFLFLCLSFLIFNSSLLIGTIRYVSKTGTSTPPYTSWETAADSIQKCINICSFGDTVYVANGIYKEQVLMIPGLSLIGAGMDSCVIDTKDLVTTSSFRAVQVADSCLFQGFYVNVYYNSDMGRGIYAIGSCKITQNKSTNAIQGINSGVNSIVYKNICIGNRIGIEAFNSNSIIRNNYIFQDYTGGAGVLIEAFDNNYTPIIDSNYIGINRPGIRGIWKNIGARPLILNNIIVSNHSEAGIFLSTSDSARVFNNLIYVESGVDGIRNSGVQYLQLFNNYVNGNLGTGIIVGPEPNVVKNNVVTNTNTGIEKNSTQPNPSIQHNDVWNTNTIDYFNFAPDSTNLSVDPMIVNEDTTQGELDFHLQKYSPLIDAGDPNILDRDGSRSDIGLYGGPYGWTYTYNDLAPRPPHNITAVNENGLIKLTWNKNTEADFSYYRIYRDTVSILIYDSTKIVGTTSDTVFYDNLPTSNSEKKYYYLITVFDNQGNQSAPSEEINVTITGLSEHPPIGFDSYALLSNYPNPFNPSTIIPYRLKEGGYVKLYIYDMKGELVKTLVNQWQASGYYEVVFQPNADERQKASSLEVPMGRTYSDMSSGVYLYQILVRGEGDIPVFSDMGKMILMK